MTTFLLLGLIAITALCPVTSEFLRGDHDSFQYLFFNETKGANVRFISCRLWHSQIIPLYVRLWVEQKTENSESGEPHYDQKILLDNQVKDTDYSDDDETIKVEIDQDERKYTLEIKDKIEKPEDFYGGKITLKSAVTNEAVLNLVFNVKSSSYHVSKVLDKEVVHRPCLDATATLDGVITQMTGYSRSYSGTYPKGMAHTFCVLYTQNSVLWTGDGFLGLDKFSYAMRQNCQPGQLLKTIAREIIHSNDGLTYFSKDLEGTYTRKRVELADLSKTTKQLESTEGLRSMHLDLSETLGNFTFIDAIEKETRLGFKESFVGTQV